MSETIDYVIESNQLLALPEVYLRVKNALDDPETGIGTIAALISNDPTMTTRLLKVANSAIYGHIARIDNLTRAMTVMGTRATHDIILATSLAHAFKGIYHVDYDHVCFWRKSLLRASVAQATAEALRLQDCARHFITGLLSDIGHMMMCVREPQLMQRILHQHEKTGHPLHLYERSTFGFDFGELGADILDSWSLPETIVTPVRFQNCPELSPSLNIEAAIVYCSSRLHPDENLFPSIIDLKTIEQCGINRLDYDAVRERAEGLFEEAVALFPLQQYKQAV